MLVSQLRELLRDEQRRRTTFITFSEASAGASAASPTNLAVTTGTSVGSSAVTAAQSPLLAEGEDEMGVDFWVI